ncbi:hypothetical protein BOSEA31B_13389 [Hyphomicrobiales bacterium]|nr:hypothetical protein BOSEA31B_13389 [Hyphomicrobiales bacterium]CAH1699160.1 hypothetical protein BOSEA1005_12213 [Hyphomicrobiales bacterium]CAI0342946.1 hypothetical protein BO1005MUT1_210011 [Hyphomicrobiales bacterium]
MGQPKNDVRIAFFSSAQTKLARWAAYRNIQFAI